MSKGTLDNFTGAAVLSMLANANNDLNKGEANSWNDTVDFVKEITEDTRLNPASKEQIAYVTAQIGKRCATYAGNGTVIKVNPAEIGFYPGGECPFIIETVDGQTAAYAEHDVKFSADNIKECIAVAKGYLTIDEHRLFASYFNIERDGTYSAWERRVDGVSELENIALEEDNIDLLEIVSLTDKVEQALYLTIPDKE